MEQDIKILEDYIELIKKGYCEDCNELCNIFGTPTYPSKKISEASEHLIKAYKELEEENEQLRLKERNRVLGRYGEIEVHDLINKTLADDYIPVSLLEETIEELGNMTLLTVAQKQEVSYAIAVLQEILEKR